MKARIDINGILQLEVENTTGYWAIQEWLQQVTLIYDVIDPSLPLSAPEKVRAIEPSSIALDWQKLATKSNL